VTRSNFILIAAIAALVLPCYASAQTPAFEVASIHPNVSGSPNTNLDMEGGRFTMVNGSLKTLIRNAYDILGFQLAGEPNWLDAERYDIVATTTTVTTYGSEQFRFLLGSLIADRFAVRVHWETRESSVFVLTVDKGGPRIRAADGDQRPSIMTNKGSGKGRMKGTRKPIAILASNLGNQLGRFVIDKTDLAGDYDWLLEWSLDPTADSTEPSLFTAVREQLGLRLTAQKGPMPVLVIDNVSKPSEN
jgi:uncharacterized protein (TIGR03435 family)